MCLSPIFLNISQPGMDVLLRIIFPRWKVQAPHLPFMGNISQCTALNMFFLFTIQIAFISIIFKFQIVLDWGKADYAANFCLLRNLFKLMLHIKTTHCKLMSFNLSCFLFDVTKIFLFRSRLRFSCSVFIPNLTMTRSQL